MILSTKFWYQFLFTVWLLIQLKINLLELSLHFTALFLVIVIIHVYLLNIIIVLNIIIIIINVAIILWLALKIVFALKLPILKIKVLITKISWIYLIAELNWIVLKYLRAWVIGLKYFLGSRGIHHLGVMHFKLGCLNTWNQNIVAATVAHVNLLLIKIFINFFIFTLWLIWESPFLLNRFDELLFYDT